MVKTRRGPDLPWWLALHRWLALPLWALLLLICLTGTLCTISQEITWLFEPKVRATNPAAAPALSFDSLEQAVITAYPGAKLLAIRTAEPYFAYRVLFQSAQGSVQQLLLNQYTGELQGEDQDHFRSFMLALHGWLLLPWQDDYNLGWYAVTLMSIPLLGSLITGLMLFKRFWRTYLNPKLRLNSGSRVFWTDWHRLSAVWSIWFILLISLSGLWFLISGILSHNRIDIYPADPVLASGADPSQRAPLSGMIKSVHQLYPDLEITTILLPKQQGEPATIMGTIGFTLIRDSANRLYLDPVSGKVLADHGQQQLTLPQWLEVLLRPLHFGDFAGLTSKLIWFVFGILLTSLISSGLVIWYQRTVSLARVSAGEARPHRSGMVAQRYLYQAGWLLLTAIASWCCVSILS